MEAGHKRHKITTAANTSAVQATETNKTCSSAMAMKATDSTSAEPGPSTALNFRGVLKDSEVNAPQEIHQATLGPPC